MTTASGLTRGTTNTCLAFSSGSILLTSTRARVSALPFAKKSRSATAAVFGWNPKEPGGGPPSASPFQGSVTSIEAHKLVILLAEDNRGDVTMVREALDHHALDYDLTVYSDGEQVLEAIEQVERHEVACPDAVLLDLNLPKQNGAVLLRRLRESEVCGRLPVIIVTSSDAPRDRALAAELGATAYFCKPADFDEYLKLGALVAGAVES